MPSKKGTVRQAAIVLVFAERLRTARTARGMTQRELADKASVTFSYISRLEAGGAAPGIDLLERLSAALKVNVIELLPAPAGGEDVGVQRDRVRQLFDAVVNVAGPETLSTLAVLLARLAETPGVKR